MLKRESRVQLTFIGPVFELLFVRNFFYRLMLF